MSKRNVESLSICDLVEDLSVYPRHAVDESNVSTLVQAIEAGARLPPPVADEKSKRIVDGWHRVRAWKRVLGPAGAVDVELRSYADEAALVTDAVALNATHGRRLDKIDRVRAAVMLERLKVPPVQIAVALHMPAEEVKRLVVKVAKAEHASAQTVPGTKKITLKRPVAHMQGTVLTDEQVKVHKMLPGTSFLLIARQLTEALRVGMVNLEDERLVAALRDLYAALGEQVAAAA